MLSFLMYIRCYWNSAINWEPLWRLSAVTRSDINGLNHYIKPALKVTIHSFTGFRVPLILRDILNLPKRSGEKSSRNIPEKTARLPSDRAEGSSPSSVEQRLAAYYISSTKGETEHLEAVIRSKRITAPFENHFVKLLLNGDSAAADVTEDALLPIKPSNYWSKLKKKR